MIEVTGEEISKMMGENSSRRADSIIGTVTETMVGIMKGATIETTTSIEITTMIGLDLTITKTEETKDRVDFGMLTKWIGMIIGDIAAKETTIATTCYWKQKPNQQLLRILIIEWCTCDLVTLLVY